MKTVIRVPTTVHWPSATAAGSSCTKPVISNVYHATLLEATPQSFKPLQDTDGVSIVPLLHGKSIEERSLYWHYPHYGNQGDMPVGAVGDGRWKTIEWYEGTIELYNLEADPSESKTVEEQTDVASRMRKS
jgi:arylsulfatase A-like enzyme